MKLSKRFLNDYISLSAINYHDLAEEMVFAGNEYEEIKSLCSATGLTIGYVKSCINHPDSDHLHITKVDVGDEELQIICGASNVTEGIKVIVAKVGSILPGGEIKKCKLAGMESEGMICSLDELGLPNELVTEEDKLGIHILGDDAVVGENPLVYLGLDDEIIDFELTANRADLLSIMGMAYEVGAIYKREVKLPEVAFKEQGNDINNEYVLDVQTDKCSMYLGRVVKNVVIEESPLWLKLRLLASGIRPINNVVDVSNYVMLEYGQPLHFFDADRLGKKVIVRNAYENEKMTTLDSNERTLCENDIVIANESEVVALAGVMGGLNSEIENDTKNIFIEAAIFDSVSIRYTSKRILRSEASNRYEKGIDPNRTQSAIERACMLLEMCASGEVQTGLASYDITNKDDKLIEVSLEKVNQALGMDLTMDEVVDTIKRLQFQVEFSNKELKAIVPTRRLDVNIKEDLIEEIGRIYGFTKIEGKMPILPIKKGSRSKKGMLEKNVRERLMAFGLMQVMTYSLTSEEKIYQFINQPNEKISILYPMTEDRKILRQGQISSLLDVYEYNRARQVENINIFEVGKVYSKIEEEYMEETLASGLLSGNVINNSWNQSMIKPDFYVIKGMVENLLGYLGLNNRYQFTSDSNLKDMHPGRSCSIYLEREWIGFFGQIHPSICSDEVYVFEIDLDKILSKKIRNIKCKEISKYPSVHKDLAFVVDKKIPSEDIMKILKTVGRRLLTNVNVFDVYEGDNVLENEKSIAYSLTFQNNERTLTDEEVTTILNKMITEVEEKIGATLRNK